MKVPSFREKLHPAQAGFTIVEAIVALTIIAIGIASLVMAMSQLNKEASISRNATGAGAILQSQIDQFLSNGPFNPQKKTENLDPCGGATPPPQIPKDYCNNPPTYDMTVTSPGQWRTIGYKDPTTGQLSTRSDPWPVYRVAAPWTYANAAARTAASGFTANDIGQLAYQSDTQTYWRLQTAAPTWVQDTTDGIIVRGNVTATVTDLSATLPNTYMAVFKVAYQYMGRGPIWNNVANRWEYQVTMSTIRTSDI